MSQPDGKKIALLVSDNQVDIRGIEQEVTGNDALNCQLYRCTTMGAAAEQLGKRGIKANIIILDLRLKEAHPPEIMYRALKDFARNTPIILLTDNNAEGIAKAEAIVVTGAAAYTHREEFSALPELIGSLLFLQGLQ